MKKFALLLTAFFLFIFSSNFCFSQSDWKTVSTIPGVVLQDAYFINEDIGFVCGATTPVKVGKIFKTTNGGETWVEKYSTDISFNDIQFVNDNIGYATGHNCIVSKTTDCGETWTSQYLKGENLFGLFFINESTGWVCGNGKIYKTIDYGENWISQNSGTYLNLYEFFFIDENLGWLTGERGTLLKTTNGGSTWNKQALGNKTHNNGIYFLDNNIGFIVGPEGNFFKTTNGGIDWRENNFTDDYLWDIYFIDNLVGYICGKEGVIYKTLDGGNNWNLQNSGTTTHLCAIQFLDLNSGYAIGPPDPSSGNNGVILKSVGGTVNPLAPQNLQAEVIDDKIKLTWDASETEGVTYNIYRSLKSGEYNYTVPLAEGLTTTSYKDSSADFGKLYYYVVRAEKDGEESVNSNEAKLKVCSSFRDDLTLFYDYFCNVDPKYWSKTDYSEPKVHIPAVNLGYMRQSNVSVRQDNILELHVNKENNEFFTSEIRTIKNYHYGKYEARIKTAEGDGLINAFFLYNDDNNKFHGEIDFEIFGQKQLDQYYVMVGFFQPGTMKHEYCAIPLDFDPTLDYHTYMLNWQPEYIEWYIDNELVYTATSNIPSDPLYVYLNHWLVDSDWFGPDIDVICKNPLLTAPGNGNNLSPTTVTMLVDYVKYNKDLENKTINIPETAESQVSSLYDIILSQCPITLLAENKSNEKSGIIQNGNIIHQIQNSDVLFDSLSKPMAIVLPADSVYTFKINAIDTGKFRIDIWKSFFKGYKHIVYIGTVSSTSNGWINLYSDTTKNDYGMNFSYTNNNNIDTIIYPIEVVTEIFDNFIKNQNSIISIYPNPSNSKISIKVTDFKRDIKVEIYNHLGKRLFSDFMNSPEKVIDISKYATGLYFVCVEGKWLKFIKI